MFWPVFLLLLAAAREGLRFFTGSEVGAWAVSWERSGLVLGWCWVAAFYVFAGSVLTDFFITISHCPWRDFISFSDGEKETEAKKTPSNR
jgi:hypothetical protein